MSLPSLFSLFFPHLVGLDISGAFRHSRTVHITAATTTRAARCSMCATPSQRVHSRYERRLADTPASGQETLIHLYVRKFFCDHTACEQKIFAEQVPGLTHRYARRTPHLTELLTHLALALGGRAGARLTTRLASAVSRMTLLRLIRATPDPEPDVPRVLGVDDFALRKGHVYGTLLVDVDTHRPVDLLDERTAEALLARNGTGKRPTLLQPFDSYLRKRFMEGCTNATALWHEIRAQGYRGGCTSVREHIRPWRAAAPAREPRPERLTVREVTAWITRHPDALDEDQRVALTDVLSRCPELERLKRHVAGFAQLMADRRGHELEVWMRSAREEKIAELDSFLSGLRRDLDAVRAGLTLPYSSGVVEGHVNRLKMLKRQMYGRAKPDLLRKRVLLAA